MSQESFMEETGVLESFIPGATMAPNVHIGAIPVVSLIIRILSTSVTDS